VPSVGPVFSAIKTVLEDDGLLNGYVGVGRVFDTLAPQNQARPYIVVSLQADTPRRFLGQAIGPPGGPNATSGDDYVILIKAITDSGSIAAADAIENRVSELLEHRVLTVAGRSHVTMHREGDVRFVETDDGVRYNHSGAQWRCWATA
jgi:Protein of unknown function (DUF3168)